MNPKKASKYNRLLALFCGALLTGAGAANGATINLLGANPPVPGPDDQSQTNFVLQAQAVPPGGGAGFNYYVDANPAPGQIFTTGGNVNGYVLNSVSLFDADGTSGGFGTTAQTFTLGIYAITDVTNANLITTFTSQSIAIPDFNWFQWTNINVVLQPNTQYAYAMWRNSSGWMNLGSVSNSVYAGGQIVVVTRGGGEVRYSSSPDPWNASFVVGLTSITTPVVGAPTFSPYSVLAPGASTTAFAPVSGPGPYYFQWQTDGGSGGALTNIPGATSSNLVIDATGFTVGTHQYDLVVSNDTSAVTGAVAVLTVQQPIGIPGVIGIKLGFTNGYATADAPYPADNTGVATGQLVPPSFQPLTQVGRWNNLLADVQPPYDDAARFAAMDQTWTIDHDSAGNALSGVTLTPGGFNDGWHSGGTECAAGRLLYDCWKFNANNGQTTSFGRPAGSLLVSGLPDGAYDVYVFINNNNGNYWGNAQANTVIAQGSPDIDNASFGFNGGSADPCDLATPLHTYSGFNGGNPANSLNYVKMGGVQTDGGNILITIALFGGGDMGVSGLELVPLPANDLVLEQDTTPNFADTVVGDKVVFSGVFSNVPPVSLSWLKISGGTTNIVSTGVTTATDNGLTTSTLTLSNVQVSDSGMYLIKATSTTNAGFYKYTSLAPLQVSNAPAPVNGIVVNYAAQAGPATFYPANWSVDTSSSNLVYGFIASDGSPGTMLPGLGNFAVDGASLDPSVLADGVLSIDPAKMIGGGSDNGGADVTYTLMTNTAPYGFDLNTIQVFGGWSDAGRRDQQYEVLYATIADPTNFISLLSTYYVPDDPNGSAIVTRTELVPISGVLAHNVALVKINWNVTPQHLNGYAFYSEIAMLGAPSSGISAVPPVLSTSASGGSVTISGTGGTPNSSYTLLEATSLTPPVNWATNSVGTLDGAGAFSVAIPVTTIPAERFFRVQLP
ncbi:MAG TPA: immunoglobulin domain-containing protein [Dongiaceae bacterium]|nr:immunoglobulin domain-containing protein [Dongiaceae bacterium]